MFSSYSSLLRRLSKLCYISFITAWANDWLLPSFDHSSCSYQVFSTCWIIKYNGYFSVFTFLGLFIAYYNFDNSLKLFPILDSSLFLWILPYSAYKLSLILYYFDISMSVSALFSSFFLSLSKLSLIYFSVGIFFLPNNCRIPSKCGMSTSSGTNCDYLKLYGWISKTLSWGKEARHTQN